MSSTMLRRRSDSVSLRSGPSSAGARDAARLRRMPPRRQVTRRRIAQQVGAGHRHHEEDEREDLEGTAPADAIDQDQRERAEDAGAGAA